MTNIALDAMGGDNAPAEIVFGAIEAANSLPDVKVILVGVQEQIEAELAKHAKEAEKAKSAGKLEVVHAPDVAEMDESPVITVRQKKDCSINVAMRMVKEGKADAMVSAGNSGAVATSAIFSLGRIAGVMRPAIATVLPTRDAKRPLLLLDAGANMDCHPDWLVQFAVMGSAYSRTVLHRENPTVGLVSIGTEDCKGNEMTKATFPLLKRSAVNFIGNVEGHDLCEGKTDVAVCDGFVGNVILKTAESVAHAVGSWLKKELMKNVVRKILVLFLKGAFMAFKKQIDPEIYGGAPLLGVSGTVIITHGSSTHKAIYHAVDVAKTAALNDMTGEIARGIAENEKIADSAS
jgi:glycerol-3-phosphate acyltransferase PlsX